MLSLYPACFYKEKEGGYSVLFPNMNHLATCGGTLDEAMEMAIDCLAGYLYDAKMENEAIPDAIPLDKIDLDDVNDGESYESAFVNMVAVDVEEYARIHFNKSVKKTLSIPQWLNDIALKNNVNFSKILQDALKEQLHISQ